MSSTPEPQNPETNEHKTAQTALACYLRTVVAIGNSMAEVCPPVGAMYRDRLLKLPRRLGFDSTPKTLEQSREAVETDLLEFTSSAAEWIRTGTTHAYKLLEHLRAMEETQGAGADLERAFLDDMAEHMQASAEVDDEAQLRASFVRYAAGLRAYSRRSKTENVAASAGLARCREEIAAWLCEEAASDFTDPATGLLNRAAAERRLRTEIGKQERFSVIAICWAADESTPEATKKACAGYVMQELAERLGATIRPYDLIFRWSEDCLITVFQSDESGIVARARNIAGWLGNPSYTVEIAGAPVVVKTHITVSVVEHHDGELTMELMERIDQAAHREAAQRAGS